MQLSKYNIVRKIDGKHVIFNTSTQAMICVAPQTADMFKSGKLHGISAKNIISLAKSGFLRDNQEEERKKFLKTVYDQRKSTELNIIVIPTYKCNLRCSYCYVKDVITSGRNIDEGDWVTTISDFLQNTFNSNNISQLKISFFGGEPLMKAHNCLKLVNDANDLARKYNIKTFTTITTNGTILNKHVKSLAKVINSSQITLDGIGQDHNKHRTFNNNSGTYDDIIQYMKLLEDNNVHQMIRFHLHDYSAEYMYKAGLELRNILGDTDNIGVYFAGVEKGCYVELMKCGDRAEDRNIETSILPYYQARNAFLSAGWRDDRVYLHSEGNEEYNCSISCGFLQENTFILDSELNIYFCPVALRQSDLKIGELKADRDECSFNELYDKLFRDATLHENCSKCEFFPLCKGGCFLKSVINNGRPDKPFCEKERMLNLIDRRIRYCINHSEQNA